MASGYQVGLRRSRGMSGYRDSNEATESIFLLSFSIRSSLLASFSKMLPPRGGKMAVVPPTYIFSGLGPILKEVSLSPTVGTEVLSQVTMYPYLK